MLISLDRKFIFIANTKTASNSIEQVLSPFADVNISYPILGKHDTLLLIQEQYDFLFGRGEGKGYGFDDFYKFGVMREPYSWLVSWYNYNSRDQLSKPNHVNNYAYTGSRSFAEYFQGHVIDSNYIPFTGCQSDKFRDYKNGDKMIADHVILYEDLNKEFKKVCKQLKLSVPTAIHDVRKNVTVKKRMTVEDLTEDDKKLIAQYYQKDIDFYQEIVDNRAKNSWKWWRR